MKKSLKEILTIAGLLLLVSCGQSVDTTQVQDDKGEEVSIDTNYERISDIQDCLNGDRPSCKRAYKEGFRAFPLLIEDLKKITVIDFLGQNFVRSRVGEDFVDFTYSFKFKHGWYQHIDVVLRVWDDNGAQMNVWSTTKTGSGNVVTGTHLLNVTSNTDAGYVAKLNNWHNSNGTYEWSSSVFNKISVDINGGSTARVIAREAGALD